MNSLEDDFGQRYLSTYNYLAFLRRRGWAYEFLRRNQTYKEQAYAGFKQAVTSRHVEHEVYALDLLEPQPDAESWGLIFFPNPDQSALHADIFWCDKTYPNYISVFVKPRAPAEVDEIYEACIRHCRVKHLVDLDKTEHLLVQGEGCAFQVLCTGQSLRSEHPVKMSFELSGPWGLEEQFRQIKATRQAYRPCDLSKPEWTQRTLLLRDGLIALDVIEAGLTLRDAAELIYGKPRVEAEWASTNRSMKDRIRFRLQKAEKLRDGGYQDFLRNLI